MNDTMADPATYGPAEQAPQPIAEEPIKKRRGRPPKDPNAPVTPRRTYTRRKKASLEDQIGGMLLMCNFVFGFMPEPWNGDAFTEDEVQALSKALDAFAQDHVRVHRYLSSILIGGGTSSIQLALVLGSIVQRRMANHGVTIYQLLGMDQRNEVTAEYDTQSSVDGGEPIATY